MIATSTADGMANKRGRNPMDYQLPDDLFDPPDPDSGWPDDPELRRAVDWFKGMMTPQVWRERRLAAAYRLYDAILKPPIGRGRFFDEKDRFGWFLFQAEAMLEHPTNYDPISGSRIVPVFKALGRNLDQLLEVEGVEARARRLIKSEKSQPNGGLFELLVAAAYRRVGAKVAFVDEIPGGPKSHDLNVEIGGRRWAVECKRQEVSDFGETERTRMNELWGPLSTVFREQGRDIMAEAVFKIPIAEVQASHLRDHAIAYKRGGELGVAWNDATSQGFIRPIKLAPVRAVLRDRHVLTHSNYLLQLLTGEYRRHASHLTALDIKPAANPRYADDCRQAVILRWEPTAAASIDGRAKDIFKKIVEATRQLPQDVPGVVHIGFEAVEGDAVERARHRKIIEAASNFDPQGKPLQYIYCHYLVPESPPDENWAFDETVQCMGLSAPNPPPLAKGFLVLPPEAADRKGPHWRS
jgi:hypothetical protein